jgi:hypothetical protein
MLSNPIQVLVYPAQANQHIYPKLILAIGLHWLAGRNLIDI